MKTGKEYPATHSMSTSWYIVDDEGNVGILDYNENGPVPWGAEQTCGDELKYGHWEDWKSRKIIRFNLTDEQIMDLLCNPHKPENEKLWFDCVVKIDKSKAARFIELGQNKDFDNSVFCLSEKLGLYEIDAFECVQEKNDEAVIVGTLKSMLDENIILEVYSTQRLDMNDEWKDDCIVHEKEFDNCPYYVFHQPYWTEALPQKMHVPEHPVTIDQIPENFRYRLHKIPGNFKDIDTFQIAQYYPCNAYSNEDPTYIVNGCSYQTSPLPDGSKTYTLVDMCEYNFWKYCSEKDKYKCTQHCSSSCCSISHTIMQNEPTVLIIFDLRGGSQYEWRVESDIIKHKALFSSYFPQFPFKTGNNSYCFRSDIEKFMTTDRIISLLSGSKGYLECLVSDFKPNVIICTDEAMPIIMKVFEVKNKLIDINGMQFPIFALSSIDENRSEIEALSNMPYRGRKHPLTISIEEMNKLVEDGIAKEYKNRYD